jgi:glutamyl-tRNA synthetase
MPDQRIRVRFAPSPTGGLHLGGVRTVLYNYLFARQKGGDFVLRIEDTDQNRFVPGAEQYIMDCLAWCGLEPDESPFKGGAFGPYRQSERKALYRPYAEQLVRDGYAYYAFDTPEELESMRIRFRSDQNPSPQYDAQVRMSMKNSLVLSAEETQQLLKAGTPHVVRIRMPESETVSFTDMVRGEVSFSTGTVDDKVLLKGDGMPTYHLAVVVDDYLMKITHAFRGEEWLPSAPVHLLLWKYLGWEAAMPQWAHLPLILKPDGHGKLSKRDGDRLGFPVFAMNWTDPKTGETAEGFREKGFLPEAFVNLLALLGWNDGSSQEIFALEELIQRFDMERVHKGGARFDYEKARWFNHEWMKKMDTNALLPAVREVFRKRGVETTDQALRAIIPMVRERCTLMDDFYEQAIYFFVRPGTFDTAAVKPKWNEAKATFFAAWASDISTLASWEAQALEEHFKSSAEAAAIKPGELLLPLRVMLVGGKFGPPVFQIAEQLGRAETNARIQDALVAFNA